MERSNVEILFDRLRKHVQTEIFALHPLVCLPVARTQMPAFRCGMRLCANTLLYVSLNLTLLCLKKTNITKHKHLNSEMILAVFAFKTIGKLKKISSNQIGNLTLFPTHLMSGMPPVSSRFSAISKRRCLSLLCDLSSVMNDRQSARQAHKYIYICVCVYVC